MQEAAEKLEVEDVDVAEHPPVLPFVRGATVRVELEEDADGRLTRPGGTAWPSEEEAKEERAAAREAQLKAWREKRIAKLQEPLKPIGRPKEFAEGEKKNLIVPLLETDHSKFKTYCLLRGLDMAKMVRVYIQGLIEGNVNTAEQIRQERFEQWLGSYVSTDDKSLQAVLDMFRELEEVEIKGGKV